MQIIVTFWYRTREVCMFCSDGFATLTNDVIDYSRDLQNLKNKKIKIEH